LVINVLLGFSEQLCGVSAEILFNDACNYRFESFEKVCELQFVLLEHTAGMTLDHRQTRARQYRRRRTLEDAIHLGSLCEVSNLCRPTVVSNSWQQIVLHDSTQRHIRTKALRRFLGHGREI